MTTLIDSNVLLDINTNDPVWSEWSVEMLDIVANESTLVINPIIYAEVSISYKTIDELEEALPVALYKRLDLPFDAAFLAGKAFIKYKKRGGVRTSPLPDFYIGAHAAVSGFRILTRDARKYRHYFPTVELIAPDSTTTNLR
jgi:predicted nucleic acid-binding protein